MSEPMRTHTCGQLRAEDIGKTVTLCGWVGRWRDHGGLIFIDLRDRYGMTQVVFNPDVNAEAHAAAQNLRNEFVIQVTGKVEHRPEGTVNPKLNTGEIDILIERLAILNTSDTPPFELDEAAGVSVCARQGAAIDRNRKRIQPSFRRMSFLLSKARLLFHSRGIRRPGQTAGGCCFRCSS